VTRVKRLEPLHVIVQGKHIAVTPALREYAEEKLGRITRYFDHVQEAQVVLSVERRGNLGKAQVVEVSVRGDGVVLRGEEASPDMYAAIDALIDKLDRQVLKHKEKREVHRHEGAAIKRDVAESEGHPTPAVGAPGTATG